MDIKKIFYQMVGYGVACAVALCICALLGSCRSYCPDITEDMFIHDTVRIVNLQHDSIFHLDSVFIKEYVKGDTVFQTKTQLKYIYKDKWKVDTCYVAKCDTIREVYTETVEKSLTWWQKFRLWVGNFALVVLLAGLVYLGFWLYRKFHTVI